MTTTSANAVPVYYGGPAWVRCEGCDEFWPISPAERVALAIELGPAP